MKGTGGAVRTLGDGFLSSYWPSFPQGHSHRALRVRHGCSVRPEQPPADAPIIAAELGAASGEIRSCLIVVGDFAGGIGSIDRYWKSLEYVQVVLLALWQKFLRDNHVRNPEASSSWHRNADQAATV